VHVDWIQTTKQSLLHTCEHGNDNSAKELQRQTSQDELCLYSPFLSSYSTRDFQLTLILLTWKIWWAPNNARKWQMAFNLAFKGLSIDAVFRIKETKHSY